MAQSPLAFHRFMKKINKSNSSHKRRKNGKGQARLRAQSLLQQDGVGRQLDSQHLYTKRAALPDEAEQKRQVWQRKQAELEARWVSAQSRQAEQYAVRRRKMKLAYTITGVILAALLLILVWQFT